MTKMAIKAVKLSIHEIFPVARFLKQFNLKISIKNAKDLQDVEVFKSFYIEVFFFFYEKPEEK